MTLFNLSLGTRVLLLSSAVALAACDSDGLGERFGGGSNRDVAAYIPPTPDERGVVTYQTYQVAVALKDDTVRAMAARFGQNVDAMSSLNAIDPDAILRAGEVVILPEAIDGSNLDAPSIGGPIRNPGTVDIETLASDAIEAADPGNDAPAASPAPIERPLDEPFRYRVVRGDTASQIAEKFGISTRVLAEWNGLGPNNSVRIGQSLLIPPPNTTATPNMTPAEPKESVSAPGQGSQVAKPPSASAPAPVEETPAPEATPEPEPEPEKPAEAGGSLMLPVNGSIIREFEKGKSDGIDIAAAAGSPVVAAGSGSVAAITKDADGVPVLVIRHADGLLTVYAGIDGITVARGESVTRGQKIAVVRAGSPAFLHFETRRGFDSVDPADFLN